MKNSRKLAKLKELAQIKAAIGKFWDKAGLKALKEAVKQGDELEAEVKEGKEKEKILEKRKIYK